MRVFKFGGASVKDADAIRNMGKIVSGFDLPLVIVVSAFGKTTNALEEVVNSKYDRSADPVLLLRKIYDYHLSVIENLELEEEEMMSFMNSSFHSVASFLADNEAADYEAADYDLEYDQVVPAGELWSSRIIASWLKKKGYGCRWVDIRKVLLTDKRYRDANILWPESEALARDALLGDKADIFLTQGFIGGTVDGMSTTLGREGSDYTAAVLASMIDASGVQVWKDVPGVLNADPKWLDDTVILRQLSYKDAVEMSFSGAKIIHPKTIKPLHNKNIPLIVRSFADSGAGGTLISGDESGSPDLPVFIKKEKQILISVLSRDFSFAIGDNLSRIFSFFYEYGIKANMVQASAVSVAVCADDDGRRIRRLIAELEKEYRIIYNSGVEMLTIRAYTDEAIAKVCGDREMLMEQKTRRTVRFVVKMY